jgi:DNA-binding NtrC family response regulator
MSDPRGSLLIVDDDKELRSVLEEILSTVAAKIDLAENGKQALDKMSQENYDCVVSDINMPVMSGLDFLKEVRNQNLSVPVVMLSAFGDHENLRQALKLGAADFVDKPFDSDYIRQVVRKALDYGASLYQIDFQIEEIFNKSTLPPDEKERLKDMQKQLMKMKAVSSIYRKIP